MLLLHTYIQTFHEDTFGCDDYVYYLIEVMTSRVCMYIPTHRIICILCVQFSVYQLYFDKLFKKEGETSEVGNLNGLISK